MTFLLVACLMGLILLSSFCSLSETSLFSLSPLTLKSFRQAENPRLRLICQMMEHPRDVLVTLLIFNTLANILVQNTVSTLFAADASWVLKVGFPLVLTLALGELIPKSLALPYNFQIAPYIAPWVHWLLVFLEPFRLPLTRLTSFISRALFFFLPEEKEISAEELRHVLKTSEKSKILLSQEADLIEGTLDLQTSIAKERMRPREEILYYDIQEPLSKLHRLIVEMETSRIPVCDGNLENVLGIVSTRRYFFHETSIQKSQDLLSILKKPYYVPETIRCWTLLRLMRERGESLAMVVDEYGSISGLITQEDLVEAVVGEISDRRDEKNLYIRSNEDVIICNGKFEISQFNDLLSANLKSKENVVTLGGWLVEQLGDIPQAGAQYVTESFLFYVLSADPNRIRQIYVRRLHLPRKR